MTDEEKKLLTNFEARLRHLLFLHEGLRRDKADLLEQLRLKEEEIARLKTDYDLLDQNYKNLKSATALSLDGGDVRDTRQRLNRLVREVDKCIALLNE